MNTESSEKNLKNLLKSFFDVLNFTSEQREAAMGDLDDLLKAKTIDTFLGSLNETSQKELKSKIENKASIEEIVALINDFCKRGNFEQSAQEVLSTFLADYMETMSQKASTDQKKAVSNLLTQFLT